MSEGQPGDRFTGVHQDIALSSKLVPSVLVKSVRINEAEIHSLERAFPDMPDPRSFSSEYDRWHKMWQLEKSSATQVCGSQIRSSMQMLSCFPTYYTRDASHCNKTIVNCQRRTQLFWNQEVENLPQVFNARRQTVSLGLTTHSPRYQPFCSSWPTPTCLSHL